MYALWRAKIKPPLEVEFANLNYLNINKKGEFHAEEQIYPENFS